MTKRVSVDVGSTRKEQRKENPPHTLSGFMSSPLPCPNVLSSPSLRVEPFCTGFELQHTGYALLLLLLMTTVGGDAGWLCSFRKPPSPHGTHTRTVYGAASTLTARRQQTVTTSVAPPKPHAVGDSGGELSARCCCCDDDQDGDGCNCFD